MAATTTKATAKDEAYWQQRFEQLNDALLKDAMDYYDDVERMYRQAMQNIEKDIARWYMRIAVNNEISYADARKFLTASQLKDFKMTLKEYIQKGKENGVTADWTKELENASAKYHISRLEAIQLQIQQHLETLFGNQLDGIDEKMRETYRQGYYQTAYEMQKGVGLGFDVQQIDEDQLEKVAKKPWAADGLNFSDRIWNDKKKLLNNLQNELIQGLVRGDSQLEISQRFAKKMNSSMTNAGRLIATESAYFASLSEHDSMKDLGVEKYDILATLDSRTSDICREMDGKTFTMSEFKPGVTAPPFHPWCRSCKVPHIEGWNGLRAARGDDGKTYTVPGSMTYKDWKNVFVDKKQTPEEWQKVQLLKHTVKTSSPKDDIIKYKEEVRKHTTKLKATMAKAEYEEYTETVAKNDLVRPLYVKYADDINEIKKHPTDGAYYPSDNRIVYSFVEGEYTKNNERNKYSALAHEYGHFFDRKVKLDRLNFTEIDAINNLYPYKQSYTFLEKQASYSDEFLQAIRKDREHLRNTLTDKIYQELRAHHASCGVQDAISGMIPGSRDVDCLVSWGHSDAYYDYNYMQARKLKMHNGLKKIYKKMGLNVHNQKKTKDESRIYDTASEAWANIISAITNGGRELEYIKKYLPNSYKMLVDILEEGK